METMIIKLHELIEEATRILRFLANEKISVEVFSNNLTFRNSLIVKHDITETPYDFSSVDDINHQKRIVELELFPMPPSRKIMTIRGTLLLLTRRSGFVEIEVIGKRHVPTIFENDISIDFRNPVQRDLSFVIDKYPDIYHALIDALKRSIDFTVAGNVKKRYNLYRIIDFIKNIEKNNAGVMIKCDVPDEDFGVNRSRNRHEHFSDADGEIEI